MTSEEKKLLEKMKKDSFAAQRIIETPQTPTAAPKVPSSLGAQDHATERETKMKERMLSNSKGQDATNKRASSDATIAPQPKLSSTAPTKADPKSLTFSGPGTMAIGSNKTRPKTSYERLLPDKSKDVFSKSSTGYMEHIDAKVAEGDRVDMNTTSFKYISYFSGLRKQIELVWIYPAEAIQRGLQGAVQLEMTIEKDGRVSKVKLVESSGFQTLDDNMLRTIKSASPFAPLPKAWGKERLVVTGSFHYILSYTGH
jgi:protein TonB